MRQNVAEIETTSSFIGDRSPDRRIRRRISDLVQKWREKHQSTKRLHFITVSLELIILFIDFNSDPLPLIIRSHNGQEDYIDRRGIHVVVGHYIGDSVDSLKAPNITKGNRYNCKDTEEKRKEEKEQY